MPGLPRPASAARGGRVLALVAERGRGQGGARLGWAVDADRHEGRRLAARPLLLVLDGSVRCGRRHDGLGHGGRREPWSSPAPAPVSGAAPAQAPARCRRRCHRRWSDPGCRACTGRRSGSPAWAGVGESAAISASASVAASASAIPSRAEVAPLRGATMRRKVREPARSFRHIPGDVARRAGMARFLDCAIVSGAATAARGPAGRRVAAAGRRRLPRLRRDRPLQRLAGARRRRRPGRRGRLCGNPARGFRARAATLISGAGAGRARRGRRDSSR